MGIIQGIPEEGFVPPKAPYYYSAVISGLSTNDFSLNSRWRGINVNGSYPLRCILIWNHVT